MDNAVGGCKSLAFFLETERRPKLTGEQKKNQHVGQINHDLDHPDPSLPLWDVVQDPRSTNPTIT